MASSLDSTLRNQATLAGGAIKAAPPAAPSATEARLKLIIETAPVSLTITTHDGTIVAANARALKLFAVERLEGLVGTKFDRLVAAEERASVVAAMEQVCKGSDAQIVYRVADGAGAGRTVEMRAVPLRRDGAAPAVCLAAMWEVPEVKAQEPVPAPAQASEALEQALAEAKGALAAMTKAREAERLAVGDALLQTRQRMQAALAEAEQRHAEAEDRHAEASIQWAAERETFNTDITQARAAAAAAATQLSAVQAELAQSRETASTASARLEAAHAEIARTREAAQSAADRLTASQAELAQVRDAGAAATARLAALESELLQAREVVRTTNAQLAAVNADLLQTREAAMITASQLAAANEQRLRAEELLASSTRRVGDLERVSRELEDRCAQTVADRQADRREFHEMVRTEQAKYDSLVSQQSMRESALAEISRLLQDAALRTERLLGSPTAATDTETPVPVIQEPAEASPAGSEAASGEEDAWQF
jgi:PAS domain S-box-containing protein